MSFDYAIETLNAKLSMRKGWLQHLNKITLSTPEAISKTERQIAELEQAIEILQKKQ